MKTLLLMSLLLNASIAFSSDEFSLSCKRSDGGISPIITYSTSDPSRVILNDGSGVGWGDTVINSEMTIDSDILKIKGLISSKILIDLTFDSIQTVDFVFNLNAYNNYLREWLNTNSDLLKNDRNRYVFKRTSFDCKFFKY